jgi:hypothetical protein
MINDLLPSLFNKFDKIERDFNIRKEYERLINKGTPRELAKQQIANQMIISWDGQKYFLTPETIEKILIQVKDCDLIQIKTSLFIFTQKIQLFLENLENSN